MKTLIYIILAVGVVLIALQLFHKKEVTAPLDSEPTEEIMMGTVTGTVTYLPRIALPEGSSVHVSLLDTSAGNNFSTVDHKEIVTQGENVPIPFTLDYMLDAINENVDYVVSAYIMIDGEMRWGTNSVPVITKGNPTKDVEIVLDQAEQSSESSDEAMLNLESEVTLTTEA